MPQAASPVAVRSIVCIHQQMPLYPLQQLSCHARKHAAATELQHWALPSVFDHLPSSGWTAVQQIQFIVTAQWWLSWSWNLLASIGVSNLPSHLEALLGYDLNLKNVNPGFTLRLHYWHGWHRFEKWDADCTITSISVVSATRTGRMKLT